MSHTATTDVSIVWKAPARFPEETSRSRFEAAHKIPVMTKRFTEWLCVGKKKKAAEVLHVNKNMDEDVCSRFAFRSTLGNIFRNSLFLYQVQDVSVCVCVWENVYSWGTLNPCNHGYQVVRLPMGASLMAMKKRGDGEKEGRCGRFCAISTAKVTWRFFALCLLSVVIPWKSWLCSKTRVSICFSS